MKQHALDYAARGWAVFPLDGKRPLVDHGFKDATTDTEKVAVWWDRWPNANIGLLPVSAGLLVVDVDGPEK
jgi:hypothetical protein